MVSFQGKERFMGESAVPLARSNYKNTISNVKRLIGRKFSEPSVQVRKWTDVVSWQFGGVKMLIL